MGKSAVRVPVSVQNTWQFLNALAEAMDTLRNPYQALPDDCLSEMRGNLNMEERKLLATGIQELAEKLRQLGLRGGGRQTASATQAADGLECWE